MAKTKPMPQTTITIDVGGDHIVHSVEVLLSHVARELRGRAISGRSIIAVHEGGEVTLNKDAKRDAFIAKRGNRKTKAKNRRLKEQHPADFEEVS